MKNPKEAELKLYRNVERCTIFGDSMYEDMRRLWIPRDKKLRQNIFHDLHDIRCARHRGCDQT